MDPELAGKRALVTGASKGIGRAVAASCRLLLVARTAEDPRAHPPGEAHGADHG